MTESTPRDSSSQPRDESRILKDLVAKCLAEIDQHGSQALEDFCQRYPQQASGIRDRVTALMNAGLMDPENSEPEIPERLGDFRLLERISVGGMGVVYLAEQQSLQRRVALKLIRPEHLFFPGARERFQREVQAVARLQHPGIVPVYTVGEDANVPFFAMELVEGCTLGEALKSLEGQVPERLTGLHLAKAIFECTYPDQESRPLEQFAGSLLDGTWQDACMRLIQQVSEALEHAHQKGVLHRDIKPSNIMVTPSGRAMLLDFGLASTEGASKITRTGSQLGSLAYMSPEQVSGRIAKLDRRADIYSLGVTLYELLTLHCPFLEKSVESTRTSIMEGRATPIRQLNSQVSWETETVCLTAMDLDPARRYRHATDFALDLSNVLHRRPIEARRPGVWLKARRWMERNPARTIAVGLASMLLIGAPIGFGLQEHFLRNQIQKQKVKAEQAASRANDLKDEMREQRDAAQLQASRATKFKDSLLSLFRVLDPETANGHIYTVRELVDSGAESVREELRTEPVVLAEMLEVLGSAYTKLGEYSKARPLLEDALALRQEQIGEAGTETLVHAMRLIADLDNATGDYDTAETMLREAMDLCAVDAELDPRIPASLNLALAKCFVHRGQHQEARKLFLQVRDVFEQEDGPESETVAMILFELGSINMNTGNMLQARDELRSSLTMLRKHYPENHLRLLLALTSLASTLIHTNEFDEAEKNCAEALQICEKLFATPHREKVRALANYTDLRIYQNKLDDALQYATQTVELAREIENGERALGVSLTKLGSVHSRLQQYELAEKFTRESLQVLEQALTVHHPFYVTALTYLAAIEKAQKDFRAAEELYQEILNSYQRLFPGNGELTRYAKFTLAEIRVLRSHYDTAEPLLKELLDEPPFRTPPYLIYEPRIRYLMGMCLLTREKFEEAEPHLVDAYQTFVEKSGPRYPWTEDVRAGLLQLYDAWGRPDKKSPYLKDEENKGT